MKKKKKPDLYKLIWLFSLKGVTSLFLHLVNLPICTSTCIFRQNQSLHPTWSWNARYWLSQPLRTTLPPPCSYTESGDIVPVTTRLLVFDLGAMKAKKEGLWESLVMVVVESRASGSREQPPGPVPGSVPPVSSQLTVGLGHGCRASLLVLSVILWACSLHLISSSPESVSIFTTKSPLCSFIADVTNYPQRIVACFGMWELHSPTPLI